MGRVFTAEALQANHVPTLEAFGEVREAVTSALQAEPAILSAVVYGSVVRGEHTIRSDFDCAVVYEISRGARGRARDVMQKLAHDAKSAHVPLFFTVCDSDTAARGTHFFGPSFCEHLKRADKAGGTIKGNVCGHFASSGTKDAEIRTYLVRKLYKLEVGWVRHYADSEERQAGYLQKMLEAPLHVARKMLSYCDASQDDSRHAVLEAYRDIDTELARELLDLVELDLSYTKQLTERLAEPRGERLLYDYCEHLGYLESQSHRTIEFVRRNLVILDRFQDWKSAKRRAR